ncbi:hypothetical protein [Streptomyces sp. NPDC002057]|uniref:hypothetical protein n=1 Tax=Streptomyces sp. NPDC002057 TaxID=3154664 RepID=UPI00332E2123
MVDEAPRTTTRDPRAEYRCTACGSPRTMVATRHKVLGAWVPEWEVQPCRSPDCAPREDPETGTESGSGAGAGLPADPGTDRGAVTGAEAASPHVTGKNVENGRSPATG